MRPLPSPTNLPDLADKLHSPHPGEVTHLLRPSKPSSGPVLGRAGEFRAVACEPLTIAISPVATLLRHGMLDAPSLAVKPVS